MFNFLTNFLEPFSHFIYLLAVFIYHRHGNWIQGRTLICYYLIALIFMLAASVMVNKTIHGNIWLYNLTSLCTTVFIGRYFYTLLQSPLKKKVVIVLIVINTLYSVIKNVVFREFYLFDSVGYSMVSASVAVFVFMYFRQVMKNVTEHNILKQFNFWLASGYLIYFFGSFIIFLSYYYFTAQILSTYTKQERDLLTALWGVHNALLFLSAVSLLIGSLWLTYRNKSV